VLKNTIRCTLDAADHRRTEVIAVHGVEACPRWSQVEHAIVLLHDQHKSEYVVTFWSDLNGVEFGAGFYTTDREKALDRYWERCRRAEQDRTVDAVLSRDA
jgi:hypothetical protein